MADALAIADQMLPAGRGSILRGGRSCVGLGSVVDASLAAAGSNTFTITIDEDCVLDRLFISTSGVPVPMRSSRISSLLTLKLAAMRSSRATRSRLQCSLRTP